MASPDRAVEAQVRALAQMKMEELREEWRRRWGAPPRLRSGDFLRRLIAERIQTEAYGRDLELERRISQLVAAYRKGHAPTPRAPTFKPGTVLVREHAGVAHKVEVLPEGFRWNGEIHDNLSKIAREITGARWSGPLFFGLRERAV